MALELNNIAIIEGNGNLIDGAALLEALNSGVTCFVEGDEAEEIGGPEAHIGYDWE